MSVSPAFPRGSSLCRGCGAADLRSVLDLGTQPLANRLLPSPDAPDPTYPLHLKICTTCGLGQVGEFVTPWDIFHDYPYLSSMSTSWLQHVSDYGARMRPELGLGVDDLVIEIASNDGHLLKGFRDAGTRVLGIEPAANVAAIANAAGVPTECAFFGLETAKRVRSEHGTPRLVVANNVLAHVPDLDDFVSGLAELCGPETLVTVENPSFIELLEGGQFDTIYHEHFSYLTAHSVRAVARKHGLELVRVETLSTHGGSNRYHLRAPGRLADRSVEETLYHEQERGLLSPALWQRFAQNSRASIEGLRAWLDRCAAAGDVVVAYGAAAKGNTLLNAARIAPSDLLMVTDESPEKQGRYLPGSHVPIVAPQALRCSDATDVLILPWNIRTELSEHIRQLVPGARIWVAVPGLARVDP